MVHPAVAAAGWVCLCLFVLYGSSGALSVDGQRGSAIPGFSVPDLAQNILLYIPFGIFGVWTTRRYASGISLYAGLIGAGVLYSIAMELLQTVSAARIASPLDVIANVIGVGIGAWAAPQAERTLAVVAERLGTTGLWASPARYALAAVAAAIVIAAWYPFDITLDVSTLSERSRPVRRDPWLWPGTIELWWQATRFLVLALVTTLSLPRLGRSAAPIAAAATIAAAIAIDLGQLGMGHYPIGVAALLSQAAGASVGAAAAFAVTTRGN